LFVNNLSRSVRFHDVLGVAQDRAPIFQTQLADPVYRAGSKNRPGRDSQTGSGGGPATEK